MESSSLARVIGGTRRGVARLARASHTVWCWRETVVTRGLVRAALRVGAVRRSVGVPCRVRRRARGRTRRRRLIGNRFLALRGVGPESEAECVRFHGRRVTKVGPEVKHGQLLRVAGRAHNPKNPRRLTTAVPAPVRLLLVPMMPVVRLPWLLSRLLRGLSLLLRHRVTTQRASWVFAARPEGWLAHAPALAARLLVARQGAGHDGHYFGHRMLLRSCESNASPETHDVNAVC